MIPGDRDKYIPPLRTAALLRLTRNYGLGGGRWIRQFVYGFPIIGEIEQTGVFPRDAKPAPPPDIEGIWPGNSARPQTREMVSGALRAQLLRGEAMGQVNKGWLGRPRPVDQCGDVLTQPEDAAVLALRFGAEQGGGGSDHVMTSNTRPQMNTALSGPVWNYQPGTTLGKCPSTAVVLTRHGLSWKWDRNPPTNNYQWAMVTRNMQRWPAAAPSRGQVSLSRPEKSCASAGAAATRYNCFLRTISVLFSRIFGIPLLPYFEALEAPSPSGPGQTGLDAVKIFLLLLGVFLNGKTGLDKGAALLVLLETSPSMRMRWRSKSRILSQTGRIAPS